MTAFDTALDTLFNDANLAVDVVYTPLSGRAFTVRGIRQRPDIESSLGSRSKLQQAAITFEIRASELTSAAKGDTLQDDVAPYRVMNAQMKDVRRKIWLIEAAPI